MRDWGDFIALLLIWLAFMAVVGVYVARIGILVREQQLMERAYRLRLAAARGREVREAGTGADRRS